MRGDDGEVSTFLNVCRHRGSTGIDRSARGLVRVPAGEAGGLVWVRPSRATSESDTRLDARVVQRRPQSRRSPKRPVMVFGFFEHGNAHFHAEIAKRLG